MMRMALYARVSTRDKDPNPETQLLRLRQFVGQHPDGHIAQIYIDQASANNLLHRTAWRQLQDDTIQHRFDAVLVFKLDRAFRSVKNMRDMLNVWDPLSIGFLSAQEGFDTTTALGRLLLNLLASLAEFELETIRERVKAGIDRAKQAGKTIGRRAITDDPDHWSHVQAAVGAIQVGEWSYRKAAKKYGVSVSSIQRAMPQASRSGCIKNGVKF